MENKLTFDITSDELEIFLEDVNECLQAMETGILHLEQQHDPETLNSIFRAAHTLKALAGAVGHRQMADLTHALETIFDEMRNAGLPPELAVIDELLASTDILKALRDEIVTRQPSEVDVTPLLARLHILIDGGDFGQAQVPSASPSDRYLTPEQIAQINTLDEAGQAVMNIEIVADVETFAPAARLYQAATALLEIGQIVVQQPALDRLSEENTCLWLILATSSEPGDIENLLRDVSGLAEFRVEPYLFQSSLVREERGDAPGNEQVTKSDLDTAAKPATSTASTGQSLSKAEKRVRISVERLDTLMSLVGELVTDRTHLLQLADMLNSKYGKSNSVGALSKLATHFSHVVGQLQDEVMRARMLPIASLFNKFPRLVRDLARIGGKQVNLIIEGEATELDRAVIEVIGDPLIHLLRNAVDHGLETPEARLAAGKPATGTIRLTASSIEGQIVVTITDDGQGIDPAEIRRAAISRGLLTQSDGEIAQLADDEIVDLIFQPNLSTATEVTEMSGRGVGLDVVRTNIERLNGSVVATTELGHGTTFQLTMPLTLALVQTMLITVRDTLYAIPVTSINGAMYLAEAPLKTVGGKSVLAWEETTVPLLDLHDFFAQHCPSASLMESAGEKGIELTSPVAGLPNGVKPSVVLVTWGKLQIGLIIDKILGQQEIVVKSLNPIMGRVPGLSGATILGDGRIAFIIDLPGLINAVMNTRR